jgi:MFS transporter, UMF1 family
LLAPRGHRDATGAGASHGRIARKRIWGWYFFDWASQPYNTLLLTFIFGPYINELLGDGTAAQTAWGFGVGAAGLVIASLAPVLGAMADTAGSRMRWIWVFSVLYVAGQRGALVRSAGRVQPRPDPCLFRRGADRHGVRHDLHERDAADAGHAGEIGRISGSGWAFGFLGGLVALVIMLAFFAESAETGRTALGLAPAFGLDPETREGTRFVGPLTAIWFVVFMVPFFLWVRDPPPIVPPRGAVRTALATLGGRSAACPGGGASSPIWAPRCSTATG